MGGVLDKTWPWSIKFCIRTRVLKVAYTLSIWVVVFHSLYINSRTRIWTAEACHMLWLAQKIWSELQNTLKDSSKNGCTSVQKTSYRNPYLSGNSSSTDPKSKKPSNLKKVQMSTLTLDSDAADKGISLQATGHHLSCWNIQLVHNEPSHQEHDELLSMVHDDSNGIHARHIVLQLYKGVTMDHVYLSWCNVKSQNIYMYTLHLHTHIMCHVTQFAI